MSSSARRSARFRIIFSWLLIVGFLCQPVLSYLATPTVVQGPGRLHTLLCTLKGGYRDVFIELPPVGAGQRPSDDCPAIKLVQLAGLACLPKPPVASPSVLYSLGTIAQANRHTRPQVHYSAYSSRAPPLA